MGAIASQITSLTIVYSIVYSDADQSRHQNSASLAFVCGFPRGPVNSPHKWPVTRKMFPFDDVIILIGTRGACGLSCTLKWKRSVYLRSKTSVIAIPVTRSSYLSPRHTAGKVIGDLFISPKDNEICSCHIVLATERVCLCLGRP